MDLTLEGFAGNSYIARSPDGSRGYEMSVASQMRARVSGTHPLPAGSTFTVTFDNRILSGLTVTSDSVPAVAQTPVVSGNVTTATFTLPVAIPANGDDARIEVGFDDFDPLWFTDIAPYSVLILPPTGTDPDLSNNGWTANARYFDTNDASVAATWRPVTIVDGNGNPSTSNVVDTVTITALAPGDVPAGGSVGLSGPTASAGFEQPYEYVDTITGVTITSARLDGVDVSGLIGTPIGNSWFTIPIDTAIPAGQSLVLDLDLEVIASAPGWVWAGGHVQFTSRDDRDTVNNNVQPPPL